MERIEFVNTTNVFLFVLGIFNLIKVRLNLI